MRDKGHISVLVRILFISDIHFASVAELGERRDIVKREFRGNGLFLIRRRYLCYGDAVRPRRESAPVPLPLVVGISYAHFSRFVIRIAHKAGIFPLFLSDTQLRAGVVAVHVQIRLAVGITALFDYRLPHAFQLVRGIGSHARIGVGQNKMYILIYERIGIRRAGRDYALFAVAADHTVAPERLAVPFFVKLCKFI